MPPGPIYVARLASPISQGERAEQVNSCEKLATRFRRSSSNICRHACFSQPHSPSMTQNLLLLKAETWDAVPKLRLYQYASVSGLLIWGHFGVGSRVSFSPRSLSCFRPTFLSVRGIAQSVSRDHASGRGRERTEEGERAAIPILGKKMSWIAAHFQSGETVVIC